MVTEKGRKMTNLGRANRLYVGWEGPTRGDKKHESAKELRAKHQPLFQNQGRKGDVNYCVGCKGPNGTLINLWPCEVIKALELGGL
jgi:hypothetical protein